MVAAFDYCLHGKGGAAPSIDTAMHGLVDAAHVDHLHPDSGIAIATAADGEALTKEIFGDKVVWVPWRRPGFQLGLDIAAIKDANPQADRLHPRRPRHHRLGRHLRGVPRRTRCGSSTRPRRTSPSTAGPNPSARLPGYERPAGRRAAGEGRRAGPGDPRAGLHATSPLVGHFTDAAVVLDFLAGAEHPRLAALGTSCPDHFLRTKVKPLVLDLPADASSRIPSPGWTSCTPPTARTTRPTTTGTPTPGLPGRCAAPTRPIVLVPGVGMFSYGKDKQTARVAGEFYLNAINVMRGAEAISTLRPDRRSREVPDRVLGAGGSQAGPDAQAQAARHPHRPGHRRGVGHRQGHRHPPRRRRRLRRHRRPGPRRRRPPRRRSAAPTSPSAIQADVTDEAPVVAAVDAALLAFGGLDLVVNNAGLSLSKPLLETTEETGTCSTT